MPKQIDREKLIKHLIEVYNCDNKPALTLRNDLILAIETGHFDSTDPIAWINTEYVIDKRKLIDYCRKGMENASGSDLYIVGERSAYDDVCSMALYKRFNPDFYPRAVGQGEWISVKEARPEIYSACWLCYADGLIVCCERYTPDRIKDKIFWMPIAKPPAPENE